ncbi:MAG: ammonium transporter [Planctomycetes bacterium]|nr:ammonium transporter [Planctomycetota bacterium]
MLANVSDTLWLIVASALVFIMQGGFLCLEAGLTRSKNSINVAIKNVTDFGISLLIFWAFGFAWMFGKSQAGWIGHSDYVIGVDENNAYAMTLFLFQAMFCGTAVTIMSGAVAERVRFVGYLVMVVVISALIYPVFGHWAWGGDGIVNGWLKSRGFVDFAGSTVVHSVGGWAALAGIIILGPRLGRFPKNAPAREVPGSNVPLAMLGVMLLWFGWIGFNGGSTLAINDQVPMIIANTMLAASAGLVASLLISWAKYGFPSPGSIINGSVGGLVAITANCHCVHPGHAVVIGAVGAGVVHLASRLMVHMKLDDAVDAVPAHLAAGIWGTLAVGLMGDPKLLGTGLGWIEQIEIQALGVVVAGALTMGVMLPALWVTHRLIGMRVTAEQEHMGLNAAEHRATTELHDFVSVIEKQSRTHDLSLRAPVEPFTEVGQIAERYNELIGSLEKSVTNVEHLKRVQVRLREAKKAADTANAAKSEFLANMSHEIRTPLHGILSFAGFGLKRAEAADKAKIIEYFQRIQTSGDRLLMLVNDLLDLSKLEAGKMTFDFYRHDLVLTIAAVVDEVESLISERDVKIEFVRPGESIEGVYDQTKIMQIIRNIINNAIRFSPAGSTITLTAQRLGDEAEIRVRDRGVGVPEGELKSIFNKFEQSSRTKSGSGGTGLGLAICTELIAAHGGRIWAENHPDGGAIFIIRMPLNALTVTSSQPVGPTPFDKAGDGSWWAQIAGDAPAELPDHDACSGDSR